ncbi:Uncharacterised protein [Mycobacteroides abscessus subsp. bolletii]|nr:Uncharacterised protein [Mycobacteroides abscessus subsp. bolletii]SKP83589.1 Uncharacterised protein [Mycobacteroides abscessus subsp. bolletii]SKP98968.1 Uncharacterised protein [Mycobacteroides abscessus subsp. bolletii]SKQ17550.1 Uncharacterised protein [Mycobacteroides abscessus subsp. bolletii]
MRSIPLIVALIVAGCSSAPGTSPSASAQAPGACESKYTRDQFVGSWANESSTITLDGSGGLTTPSGTGQWDFTSWEKTPQEAPPGQQNQCVLWLKEPPLDLVYFPLDITRNTLSLSYVGKGNTVTWTKRGLD